MTCHSKTPSVIRRGYVYSYPLVKEEIIPASKAGLTLYEWPSCPSQPIASPPAFGTSVEWNLPPRDFHSLHVMLILVSGVLLVPFTDAQPVIGSVRMGFTASTTHNTFR
jgi:hypothetical protein